MGLENLGPVLIVFLVLSVVFEVAMTPVFNSRFFLRNFEGKGVKVPLTIAIAIIIFWSYDLDIVQQLLTALGQSNDGKPIEDSFGGQVLTAFLIAGGSDGVFRIFTKLGIRNPKERKEKTIIERQSTLKTMNEQMASLEIAVDKYRTAHDEAVIVNTEAENNLEDAKSSNDDQKTKNAEVQINTAKMNLEDARSKYEISKTALQKKQALINKEKSDLIALKNAREVL